MDDEIEELFLQLPKSWQHKIGNSISVSFPGAEGSLEAKEVLVLAYQLAGGELGKPEPVGKRPKLATAARPALLVGLRLLSGKLLGITRRGAGPSVEVPDPDLEGLSSLASHAARVVNRDMNSAIRMIDSAESTGMVELLDQAQSKLRNCIAYQESLSLALGEAIARGEAQHELARRLEDILTSFRIALERVQARHVEVRTAIGAPSRL